MANLPPPSPQDRMTAAVARLDFGAFVAKVGDVANRLCLLGVQRALRPPAAERLPAANGEVPAPTRRHRRDDRRALRKERPLSAAGKARVDLQLKMLGAIPAKARPPFVLELVEHARKYPASVQYLRDLADQGNVAALDVVARIGGER